MSAAAGDGSGPPGGSGVFPESTRLFLAQIVGNAGFFAAVLLLARLLGPSGRGTVAFVTVSCLVLARVSSLGVQEASTFFGAKEPERRGSVLTNLLLFTVGSTVVVAGLAVLGLELLGITPESIGSVELALLFSGTVIAGLVDGGIAYLYGVKAFAIAASITAVAPWTYVALLGLGEATGGMSPRTALLCWLGAHLLWATALGVGAVRLVRPTRADFELFRRCLRYGIRAWVGTMARFANFRADQLLLGFLATEAILGTYAVSVNASEMLLYLPAAVASVLVSSVVGSAPDVQAMQVRRAFRVVSLLTLGATTVAVLLGPILIPLVFGREYEPSVNPFVVLALGSVGYVASAIFSGGLLGASRPGRASFGPLTSLVAGVSLDFALIPSYGATGAALAAAIAFALGGVVSALAFRATFGLTFDDLRPKASDLRTLASEFRRLGARGRLMTTGVRRALGGLPDTQFSLHSSQYYWTRARFERVRLRLAAGRSDLTPSVRILAYHRISDDRDFLAVDPEQFRRQLEHAVELGLEPIRLRDAVTLLGGADELDRRYLCVTFDDGYLDNVESALPHLEALGVPATVFLPSDIVSGRSTYHWYRTPPQSLSWAQAREAAAGGLLEFEAHGKTHRVLPRLDVDELREEVISSRDEIERELERDVQIFCYPAGLYGAREAELIRDSGYAAAVTTQPGVNQPGDDLFRLRRTTIAWSDTLASFDSKICGALDSLSSVESWVRMRRSRA